MLRKWQNVQGGWRGIIEGDSGRGVGNGSQASWMSKKKFVCARIVVASNWMLSNGVYLERLMLTGQK